MKIGIYEQAGRLVKGDLEGYGKLASNLNAAMSLCYINVTGREEIILGSCIKVKKGGGRENRRMPICKTEMREIKRLTSEFFKSCVTELEKEGYKIIGSIKEGDVQQLTEVEEAGKQFDGLLESAVGKVVLGENVIVRASNPADSVSFIGGVIRELEPVLHLGFTFDISETPSTSDINIIPEVKKWDIDLDNSVGKEAYSDYYKAYKSIKEYESIKNREELKEKIVSQEWVIGFNRALRDKDVKQIKKLYEERRKEFLENLVDFSDTIDISWVINEIGDNPNPPQITREVAAKLFEKVLGGVDTRAEKLLIGLYNQFRRDKDFLKEFLNRIMNIFGNRMEYFSGNFRQKILDDGFEYGDDELVRTMVMQWGFIPIDAKIINRISKLGTQKEEKIAPDSAVHIICSIVKDSMNKLDEYGDIFLAKLYEKIPRNSFFFDDLHSQIDYSNIISSKHPNLKFKIVNDAIKLGKINKEKLDALGFMKEYPSIRKEMESTSIKKQLPVEEQYIEDRRKESPFIPGKWSKEEKKKRKRRTAIKRGAGLSAVVIISILAVLFGSSLLQSFFPDQTPPDKTLPDKKPPAAISDLAYIGVGDSWINWTWTNPKDDDFHYTTVYLNGRVEYIENPLSFYNATNLTPDTEYKISTRTVDKSGNISATWMNWTAKTKKGE